MAESTGSRPITMTDWSRCFICKRTKNKEKIICPGKSKTIDARGVYENLIRNVDEFNSVCEHSMYFNLKGSDEGEGILETLCENNAKWHTSCRNRFNKLNIDRARAAAIVVDLLEVQPQEMQTEDIETADIRRSGRVPTVERVLGLSILEQNRSSCLFCKIGGETRKLHRVSTFQIQDRLKTIAMEKNDTSLLSMFALGDFVAQERAYHLECYCSYCNPHDRQTNKRSVTEQERHTSLAFAEIALFLEESDQKSFKLAEIMKMYKDIYADLTGTPFLQNLHSTRFKERLLLMMPQLREVKTGKEYYIFFDEGVRSLYDRAIEDMDDETIILWRAAKLIRRDIALLKDHRYEKNLQAFEDQEQSVPSSLVILTQMMLTGGSKLKKQQPRFQESLSISQIIFTNSIAHRKGDASHKRYSAAKETPLLLYIGALLYQKTRSQNIINTLFSLGLCVSYKRVINLSEDIAEAVTQHFEKHGVMCPPLLSKKVFTTAAVDNIDHNPTSSTAQRSFHGTGLSFFQHPISKDDLLPLSLRPLEGAEIKNDTVLQNFLNVNTDVPFVHKDPVPFKHQGEIEPNTDITEQAFQESRDWLQTVEDTMYAEECSETVMWSAFHARKAAKDERPKSTSTMLPLLDASSINPGTIKHVMNTVQDVTNFLNPGQTSVLAGDQPLFLICKEIQWAWPADYGLNKFVILMGGLHIEFEIMKILGNLLDNSGWTYVIAKAGLCGSGTADSMLKAKDLKKTRYAYQVTASCLSLLQRDSYQNYADSTDNPLAFTEWRQTRMKSSSHFFFWDYILEKIQILFAFIWTERSSEFDVYVEVLKVLAPLLFALDKQKYAKCVSIHLHDLHVIKSTNASLYEQIARNFTVRKSERPFSCVATDHAHEMNNETAKGSLNVISLMDTPRTLNRWMLASPQIQEMLTDFESTIHDIKLSTNQKHLDDSNAKNCKMFKDVSALTKSFLETGNPFEETSNIHNLETGEQPPDDVVTDLRRIDELGTSQYKKYVEQRLLTSEKGMKDVMHRNNLKLPSCKPKTEVKHKKAKMLRSDYGLFVDLLLSYQNRHGDLDEFFRHENHSCPPSLTDGGKIRITASKSDLVPCLLEGVNQAHTEAPHSTCTIVDAAFLVQATRPAPRMTFFEYAESKLFKLLVNLSDAHGSTRIDVVFDRYFQNSIKDAAREKRGNSCERTVRPEIRVPKNWNGFLSNSKNKDQLFKFLAKTIIAFPTSKTIVATHASNMISNCSEDNQVEGYATCDHEEADTRMILHARQAVESGHTNIMLRSSDTDVLVLAVAHFKQVGAEEFWIATGTGKHYRYIPVHEVYQSLGPSRSAGLPFLHAFSGCDTVSSFTNVGKKTHWIVANSNDSFWPAFEMLSKCPQTITDTTRNTIERYTVLIYDKLCEETNVNAARRSLVARGRTVDRIPPTQAALIEHTKRAAYQAGHIWGNTIIPSPELPDTILWGWKLENSKLVPMWTPLPEASKACRQLIKCKCSIKGRCTFRCRCKTAELPCTELCLCKGECDKPRNESENEEINHVQQEERSVTHSLDTIEPMQE